MKRILIIAAALLMVCACAKDVPGQYRGDYTFKTGGSIDLAGSSPIAWDLSRKTP